MIGISDKNIIRSNFCQLFYEMYGHLKITLVLVYRHGLSYTIDFISLHSVGIIGMVLGKVFLTNLVRLVQTGFGCASLLVLLEKWRTR